eukprot:SM000313S11971  [mRNA]  locus=s313:36518:37821:- [translate_table: standard]
MSPQVWVLDATPGNVRAGGDGEDHPAELIAALQKLPPRVQHSLNSMSETNQSLSEELQDKQVPQSELLQIDSRRSVVAALQREGFSQAVAQWMTTNLREEEPVNGSSRPSLCWTFDIQGIAEMYQSYELDNLWSIVENIPEGVHIDFLRAERSLHRWAHEDVERIHAAELVASSEGAGVQMHVLEDAGHWVHADNPDGLFRVLANSFVGGTTLVH